MKKSNILCCYCCFIFVCNQSSAMSQDKSRLHDASVQTVQNPKIRLDKIAEIHLKENEEDYIGNVQRIRVDGNRIYLMDKSRKRVLMFSMDGEFVRAMGRSGEGPGEFRYLYTMDVKGNLVACFDQGNLRITLFDTSGVFKTSFGTRSQKSVPLGNCVAITLRQTILHCQQPVALTKEQDLAHSYPWLICEFDTLGNVLSHYGEFNRQIVNKHIIGDKIEKPLTEFKWSFPRFIIGGDSQTYLYFHNIPIVVEYETSHTVSISKVFNIETSITRPRWVDSNAEKLRHLSREARMKLAIQRMKNQHSVTTHITDITYLDKHSLLLVLQAEERRQGNDRIRAHYLSAFDVNTGRRLITDMHLQSERSLFLQRIAADADGFVYCIQDDRPGNFVIAKYEIVLGEI